jgi:hypothetical protein
MQSCRQPFGSTTLYVSLEGFPAWDAYAKTGFSTHRKTHFLWIIPNPPSARDASSLEGAQIARRPCQDNGECSLVLVLHLTRPKCAFTDAVQQAIRRRLVESPSIQALPQQDQCVRGGGLVVPNGFIVNRGIIYF